MKRVLVIDSDYPSTNNLGDVFVHVRLKEYIKYFDVQVAGENLELPSEYTHEGIPVKSFRKRHKLAGFVLKYKADILIIHAFFGWMFEQIILKIDAPVLIWVHGGEALTWYRRMFKYSFSLQSLKYLVIQIPMYARQMFKWRRLISYSNKNGGIIMVFVSKWMKKMLETDSLSRIINFKKIPNPVDTDLFQFSQKTAEHRKKILILRSFGSKKYAGDIIVETILELSKKDFFQDLSFHIQGWGNSFDKLTEPLRKFSNIILTQGFVEHCKIPILHRDYGVFFCPTRQDSQGVSMCEAMSSGLVPITSLNTAIPEFVKDGETGYLTKSSCEAAEKIQFLYENPEKFLAMSEKASESMERICGYDATIAKEIELIENCISEKEKIKKTEINSSAD